MKHVETPFTATDPRTGQQVVLKNYHWRWVGHPVDGELLYDIGIAARPSPCVLNPKGYPEPRVLEALAFAQVKKETRIAANRKKGAAKAARTRADRHALQVDFIAHRIVDGKLCGPLNYCVLCMKPLTDAESIGRGIGSDCWQGVLKGVEKIRAAGYVRPNNRSLSAWIMKKFGTEVRHE